MPMFFFWMAALVCLVATPMVGLGQAKVQPLAGAPPLPEGAIARLGGGGMIAPGAMGIALSPDGKRAAIGGPGGMVIWNVDQSKILHDYSPASGKWPVALTWSANGRLVANVFSDLTFQVREAATGKPLWDNQPRPVSSVLAVARAVRFIADDRYLAVVQTPIHRKTESHPFEPKGWQVDLWNVESGKFEKSWHFADEKRALLSAIGDGYHIRHVSLSPSGTRSAWLASSPADKAKSVAFILDTEKGKLLQTLKDLPSCERIDLADEGDTIVCVPERPKSDTKIVTARASVVNASDSRVRFQCEYRFRPAKYVDPHFIGLVKVALENAAVRFGDALLTMDEVGITRWDFNNGKKIEELAEPIRTFAMSANGKRIAIRDRLRVGVSDGSLASLRGAGTFAERPMIRFLPDGRLLGADATLQDDGILHVWSAKRELLESQRLFALPPYYRGAAHTDAWGKTLVGQVKGGFATFDLTSAARLALIKTDAAASYARLSEDGKRVLLHEFDKQSVVARWLDARDGREIGRMDFALKGPFVAADFRADFDWFTADGSIFGHRDDDMRLTLFRCDTKEKVAKTGFKPANQPSQHKWEFHSAGFDRLIWARPTTSFIDVPDKSKAPQIVWDRQGRMLRHFTPQKETTRRNQVNLSPDGRMIAHYDTKSQAIELVDTATGRRRGQIFVPQPHEHHADRTVDFSPDSLTLATSAKTSILLWDLARPLNGKAALPTPKSVKEADALWEKLGDPDPAESDRALWALVAAPEHTLTMMKDRLKPVVGPDVKRVQALIKQMDSVNFKDRDAASKELRGMKETALPILRVARQKAASSEQSGRLDEVITALEERLESPDAIRFYLCEIRALEVLERIGSDKARQQVAAIATGSDGAVLTFEAQLVLARWQ